MARKKIVFVIVEGVSDDEALSGVLSRWFDKNKVFFYVMRCDITTQDGVRPDNIRARITRVIQEYAANNFFKKIHFQQVIHITDMDGAFMPDDRVIEDATQNRAHYSTDGIRCKNRSDILIRNKQKRENLEKLSSAKEMWTTIPYSIYYMSCNLDHVLYNKLNTSDEEKENNAHQFAKQYKQDIPGFVHFISKSDFSVSGSYAESWAFIKQEKRSLERYTNLGLCFDASREDGVSE